MKKTIFILFLLSSITCFSQETQMTEGGELPLGISSFLDKMSTGFAGSLAVNKVCNNIPEEQAFSYNMNLVKNAINLNLPPQYRKQAFSYFELSMSQKRKAFSSIYQNKTCQDMKQIDFISTEYGFKF